jgi:hypothetical protein
MEWKFTTMSQTAQLDDKANTNRCTLLPFQFQLSTVEESDPKAYTTHACGRGVGQLTRVQNLKEKNREY